VIEAPSDVPVVLGAPGSAGVEVGLQSDHSRPYRIASVPITSQRRRRALARGGAHTFGGGTGARGGSGLILARISLSARMRGESGKRSSSIMRSSSLSNVGLFAVQIQLYTLQVWPLTNPCESRPATAEIEAALMRILIGGSPTLHITRTCGRVSPHFTTARSTARCRGSSMRLARETR
jgi:hypothetical protein